MVSWNAQKDGSRCLSFTIVLSSILNLEDVQGLKWAFVQVQQCFVWFILTLKKAMYKYQFSQFAWTHDSSVHEGEAHYDHGEDGEYEDEPEEFLWMMATLLHKSFLRSWGGARCGSKTLGTSVATLIPRSFGT